MRGGHSGRVSRGVLSGRRLIDGLRPVNGDQLDRIVRLLVDVRVPRVAMVEGNDAPFEYLLHSFFERGDVVVWANRGGGKTFLGALATYLDLVFKPGVQVRILGGSLEQSGLMYRYLRSMIEREKFGLRLVGSMTEKRIELINGSAVEVLSQSERSVRGQRVHKIRCDEVEMFDAGVWDAAQRVTRSGACGKVAVKGTVEALSTMHRPYGLMRGLVRGRGGGEGGGGGGGGRVLRWCAMDVIARCEPERSCDDCRLWAYCGGVAKQADGFVSVDDMLAARERSSDGAWESEMMCWRPKRSHCVYPDFDPTVGKGHVRAVDVGGLVDEVEESKRDLVVGGMDFGMRGAMVMLLGRVRRDGVLEVFGEHFGEGLTLDQNLERIQAKGWVKPAWVGVDPAGCQRNSQTGLRDVDVLKRWGYSVRWCRSLVRDGVEAIRGRLEKRRLLIDPGCERLIESLATYHFDERKPERQEPVKDGSDHGCDALRYLVVNLERGGGEVEMRSYL